MVREVPLDDRVDEGPHAQAKRIQHHARRSGWPWAASSMRLKQNIQDSRAFAHGVDLQEEWGRYSSVLKPGGSRRMGAL
eukprot:254257-Pyramimonas_sp.AAC.1